MFVRACVLLFCLAGLFLGQDDGVRKRCVETESKTVAARTEAFSLTDTPKAGKYVPPANAKPAPGQQYEYRLLATNKTSTMQKEMNQAAEAGFRLEGTMGGETAFGGSEVVVLMSRDPAAEERARYQYKLLATSKTSTMQKELQQAGDAGFRYKGQSIFSSMFGGKEVVVILERPPEAEPIRWEYKLLATSRTSTMQKELNEAGAAGFAFVGVTVGESAFGGKEMISILRRSSAR